MKIRANLDNTIFLRGRVKSILNIALANDAEMADDVDGSGSEQIIIGVRESLRRGNDNRVASVNTQRIEVLYQRNRQPF